MFPPLQVVQELYDEASLSAVLQEWYRTFADLPFFMRQSVQLGLFSSAQLVRFLCMDVRPGITRQVTRTLSPKVCIQLQTASCDSERLQETDKNGVTGMLLFGAETLAGCLPSSESASLWNVLP